MSSTFNISFTDTLKSDIKESDIVNFMKAFIFYQTTYIFESEPQSSIQKDNGNIINITDTIVPVKSLIPKNKNCYVDLVAQKEWQLSHPDNETVNIYQTEHLLVNIVLKEIVQR
jgi:hypothetical protein